MDTTTQINEVIEAPKPTITAKEVSWQECVAALHAKRQYEQTRELVPLNALRVGRAKPVDVAGVMMERYALCHDVLLEQLESPLIVKGRDIKPRDLALAYLVFSDRELMEGVFDTTDEAQRTAMLDGLARQVMTELSRSQMRAFETYLMEEFGVVKQASGQDDKTTTEALGNEAPTLPSPAPAS